ncbi:MAG TPA: hypothetical protein VM325_01155 [Alphaproteobacteria bacterium]|nr:hypothetical protein [Alphaproteobacteria bacterium]
MRLEAKAALIVAGTVALGAIVGIAVGPLDIGWSVTPSDYDKWPKTPNVSIVLPDNAGRLRFYRRGTHPYLAEFERRLEIVRPDGSILKQDIFANTGGQTFIKLYWYPGSAPGGPYLRTQDRHGQIVVSLGEGWVQRLVKREGSYAFVWPRGDYGVEICLDKMGRRHACGINAHTKGIEYVTRRVPAVVRNGAGTYVGLIDGRFGPLVFVPASLNSNPGPIQ